MAEARISCLFDCKTLNRSFDLGTDTDGFVIPSLEIEQENANDDSQADTSSPKIKAEDNIHLGPHGGDPPSQLQDGNASSRKQRFK
ncbi:hypothetical protein Bca101_032625 [Brassica carinata]